MTTNHQDSLRLFYFVTDAHPAWRVDLTELFSHELRALGISTDWSMRRDDGGFWKRLHVDGEEIFLPAALPGMPLITPIVRRLGEVLGECRIFLRLLFGPRYDIIQVRDDRYTAALFALLAARLRGCRFVYWVSFPFPENDLEKSRLKAGMVRRFLELRSSLTAWWLYKFILPRADHVFVQSEAMKADIAAYGLPADSMTPVPMGVSADLLSWRKTLAAAIEPASVAYLGTFARARHLETLIDAFALVLRREPAARLYMVGRGDTPADHSFLEDRCKELGIVGSVVFPGFLSKQAAWQYVACAAVCITPVITSRILKVGSPTKLYEYLALGRPVVANHHPEQTRAIQESGAGLCVDWRPESFAEAIVWMLQHPAEAEAMGQRGPAWIDRNQRYDRIARLVSERYRALVAGAAAAREC